MENPQIKIFEGPVSFNFLKAHIYTTSKISVWASESQLGRNQNKWIDVLCLHWSESVSEIFVADVRTRRYM